MWKGMGGAVHSTKQLLAFFFTVTCTGGGGRTAGHKDVTRKSIVSKEQYKYRPHACYEILVVVVEGVGGGTNICEISWLKFRGIVFTL